MLPGRAVMCAFAHRAEGLRARGCLARRGRAILINDATCGAAIERRASTARRTSRSPVAPARTSAAAAATTCPDRTAAATACTRVRRRDACTARGDGPSDEHETTRDRPFHEDPSRMHREERSKTLVAPARSRRSQQLSPSKRWAGQGHLFAQYGTTARFGSIESYESRPAGCCSSNSPTASSATTARRATD